MHGVLQSAQGRSAYEPGRTAEALPTLCRSALRTLEPRVLGNARSHAPGPTATSGELLRESWTGG
eukprot:3672383-Pyramimonas_sp.AAC.1